MIGPPVTPQRSAKIALATAVLLLLFLPINADAQSASGRTIAAQIQSFNNNKHRESAAIGAEILRSSPGNATSRYYYAQSLVKLNRHQEAIAEFSKCYNTTKDPTMKSYSYTALQTLLRGPAEASSPNTTSPGTTSPNTTSPNTTSPGTTSPGTNAATDGAKTDTANIDASVLNKKLQILQEGNRAIEQRRSLMNSDIGHAKERAREQMQGIPQFIEIPIFHNGWRVGTKHIDNPNYQEALANSQRELAAKTEQANKDFERRETEITEECKRRAAVYDQVSTGLKSQQKAGTSQIQLMPQNSSVYVRHFVNYDGSAPVGIKTRQKALPLKSSKAVETKAQRK